MKTTTKTTKTTAKQSNVAKATAAPQTIDAIIVALAEPSKVSHFKKAEPKDITPIMVTLSNTKESPNQINVRSVGTILPLELDISAQTMTNFCFNIMAGTVSPSIMEASQVRGGVKALIPHMNHNVIAKIDNLLKLKADVIVAKWNAQFQTSARKREVSLSGLIKACKAPAVKSDKLSLKDTLIAWTMENAELVDELPESLAMIFEDFELLTNAD